MHINIKKTWNKAVGFLLALVLLAGTCQQVYAAEADITFGSDEYSFASGGEFQVDVYIDTDEDAGNYYVELAYDTDCMEYESGAEEEEDGVLVLKGTATGDSVHYVLNFDAIAAGESGIYLKSASILTADGNEAMIVPARALVHIKITGEDETDNSAFTEAMAEVEKIPADVSLLGQVNVDGTDYYLVDLSKDVPEEVNWDYKTVEDTFEGQTITFLTNNEGNIRYLVLLDEDGNTEMYAYGPDGTFYPCVEDKNLFYMSADANSVWPDGLTKDQVKTDGIVYVQMKDGNSGFYKQNDAGDLISWDFEGGVIAEGTTGMALSPSMLQLVECGVGALILLIILIIVIKKVRKAKRRKKAQAYVQRLQREIEERVERIPTDDEYWLDHHFGDDTDEETTGPEVSKAAEIQSAEIPAAEIKVEEITVEEIPYSNETLIDTGLVEAAVAETIETIEAAEPAEEAPAEDIPEVKTPDVEEIPEVTLEEEDLTDVTLQEIEISESMPETPADTVVEDGTEDDEESSMEELLSGLKALDETDESSGEDTPEEDEDAMANQISKALEDAFKNISFDDDDDE